MDFMVGLPCCRNSHDTIWVIVDRLTKSSHFLPIKNSDSLDKLAQLYVKEITWYTSFHYFRQRSQVYLTVLAQFTECPRH